MDTYDYIMMGPAASFGRGPGSWAPICIHLKYSYVSMCIHMYPYIYIYVHVDGMPKHAKACQTMLKHANLFRNVGKGQKSVKISSIFKKMSWPLF